MRRPSASEQAGVERGSRAWRPSASEDGATVASRAAALGASSHVLKSSRALGAEASGGGAGTTVHGTSAAVMGRRCVGRAQAACRVRAKRDEGGDRD